MLVLYLDTTTGRWYDDNGIELDSSSPKFAFQSRDTLKICAVTATSDSRPLDNDPLSWPRDLQWSGKLAKITVDNDYIHRIKGELTSFITGHVTSITAAIPSAKESMIPSSGNLRVMLSDSQYEVIPYTALGAAADNCTPYGSFVYYTNRFGRGGWMGYGLWCKPNFSPYTLRKNKGGAK